MLVYIMHNDKIDIFRLSEQVVGKYLISDVDKYNNKRNLVNVEGRNGKWFIFGNENVKITYNNQFCSSIELVLYNFYQLTVLGAETILLYVLPSYDNSFFAKEILDDVSIEVGSEKNCDIFFNGPISSKQLSINYTNGCFSFNNLESKVPVYLNRVRQNFGIIRNFDTLFVMGLKIIVCGNKIFINNPGGRVCVFGGTKYKSFEDAYIIGDHDTNVRSYTNFYDESDYYAKSPLFRPQIKPFSLMITEPPQKIQRDKSSVLMNVIPTLLMSLSSLIMTVSSIKSYKSGMSSKEDLLSALVMCFAMIFAGILWPFVERLYNNITVFFSNLKRVRNYRKYLKKKAKLLSNEVQAQKMTYVVNYIDFSACQKVIEKRSPELFSRDCDSDDFLNIRLGRGDVELNCTIDYSKPDYVEEGDDLLDDVDKVIQKYRYIVDIPFVISLIKRNIIAFILSERKLYDDYMSGVILQLLTFHSFYDLKIVVLTSDDHVELSYLKSSSHCWNDNRTFRYFASNLDDAQSISSVLERELKIRQGRDKEKTIFQPYYLIISDCIDKYRNLNIINDILNLGSNLGFGLLMYDTKISNIPSGCVNFVNVSTNEGSLFQINMNNILKFIPEFTSAYGVNVDYCSRLISNIPLKNSSAVYQDSFLPDSIGFLEMYEVGNIEQLNCAIRWENSDPFNSLSVPVGIDVNGNFVNLDLHEKNHGPHGLIAGMTGSGKSEFIITYILSLAVNYRPEEVQFLLIDYKGGGLAGAFENRKEGIKLPHLVGTITNLDTSEMKRTLVSIKSELQRRQRIFNKAKEFLDTGNIDIYKYQKLHREGVLKDPLSHLFIICDEFAELKAQQPDFMDELVSAARIGRSLGIHLILATQKPSGVVDEQIWSNSKFKVCCKVQTVDDSNEMLRKPDAAYLRESGRFYLQVGYDEYYILGQSAYSGMPYVPSETVVSKIDNVINFVNNIGEVYKNVSKKSENVQKRENIGEELINILKYIISVADQSGYKYQQLWLDNIPSTLYYDYVIRKYELQPTLYNINPVIGEYDNPAGQTQGYVSLPMVNEGNVFVCGASGSGKNTLFFTIIYSTIFNHNCDEVNIYILDFGTEKLVNFKKAPQVGDVLTIADNDKINYLFYMLENMKNERQKYYAKSGGDFSSDVMQKKCPFPNILIFIYDLEVFKETFDSLYDDHFVPFTRNCAKFGFYFIVSSTSPTSLGYFAENNFPKKIMLNMVDPTDYSFFFDTNLIPSKNPGRGLVKINDGVFEFQVPLIFSAETVNQKLNYVFKQLDKFLVNKAKPVPTIPDIVTFDYIEGLSISLNAMPIGVNLLTAQISFYDFSQRFNLISASRNNDGLKFICFIVKCMQLLKNHKIIVINGIKDNALSFGEDVKYYDSAFKKVVPVIYNNVCKYNDMSSSENDFIIFILGYNRINKVLDNAKNEDENMINLEDLLVAAKSNNFFKFIIYEPASSFDEIKNGEITNYIDDTNGIWIGRGFENQNCFDAPDAYNDDVKLTSDSATLVKNGKAEYAKFVRV